MISEAGRMSGARGPGRVFFWQGLLILLPVGLMAGIGLMAILRDKAAVERQARRARRRFLGSLPRNWDAASPPSWQPSTRAGWNGSRASGCAFTRSAPAPAGRARLTTPTGPAWTASELQVWAVPGLPPEAIFPDRLLVRMAGPGALAPGDDQPPRPPDWFLGLAPKPRRASGNLAPGAVGRDQRWEIGGGVEGLAGPGPAAGCPG